VNGIPTSLGVQDWEDSKEESRWEEEEAKWRWHPGILIRSKRRHVDPHSGVDKKATKVCKTKNGEKTFYWCHRKTGGQCNPGTWRTHKPEDHCHSDEIKAEREKKQKDEKSKGKTLKADQTAAFHWKR
jgi:hypothetical protein